MQMDSAPVGVILAGGLSRRMGGGDKALLPLGQGTLVSHVAARLGPQVSALALNANGDATRFAALGLPVLADSLPDHPGPLAGILAAMDWAAGQGAHMVVTAPADTPFLPRDLVSQLERVAEASGAAIAASGGRTHPVCGLWPVAARADLRAALAGGMRRLSDWTDRLGAGIAPFPDTPEDPFFNVNTPEDLARARARIGAEG